MTDNIVSLVGHKPLVSPGVEKALQRLADDVAARGCIALAYSIVRADGTTTHGISAIEAGDTVRLLGSMTVNATYLAMGIDRASTDAYDG